MGGWFWCANAVRPPKISRIFAAPSAVLGNEMSSNVKGTVGHTDVPNCAFSHQAGNYEDDTRTEDDEADLHRQVDPEDFVFA